MDKSKDTLKKKLIKFIFDGNQLLMATDEGKDYIEGKTRRQELGVVFNPQANSIVDDVDDWTGTYLYNENRPELPNAKRRLYFPSHLCDWGMGEVEGFCEAVEIILGLCVDVGYRPYHQPDDGIERTGESIWQPLVKPTRTSVVRSFDESVLDEIDILLESPEDDPNLEMIKYVDDGDKEVEICINMECDPNDKLEMAQFFLKSGHTAHCPMSIEVKRPLIYRNVYRGKGHHKFELEDFDLNFEPNTTLQKIEDENKYVMGILDSLYNDYDDLLKDYRKHIVKELSKKRRKSIKSFDESSNDIVTLIETVVGDTPDLPPDYVPPAIVQQIDHQESQQLVEFLKDVENDAKKGFKNGRWYPHKSFEGGADTIAYGHKIQPGENFSNGITEEEALNLLNSDIRIARKKVESEVLSKFGVELDLYPKRVQDILTEYTFNLGSVVRKFPKFTKAVLNGDWETAKKEYKRYSNGTELKRRNQLFYKVYLKDL